MTEAAASPHSRAGIERPIQFNAPMVRAILDGVKTQTRRAIIPEPDSIRRIRRVPCAFRDERVICCHLGKVRDRLWVRERWAMDDERFIYAADAACALANQEARALASAKPQAARVAPRWRPSYMMPRSACRILLEITSIRMERLAHITRADARSEGCPRDSSSENPIAWFRDLWDGLCKPQHVWKMNPWVWVIGFKRIETRE